MVPSFAAVCQDLPELENGMIFYSTDESPRAVGTVATHRCNEGFILIGVENRTCQDDTEFSDSPPTCERKSLHSAFEMCYHGI